MRKSFKEYILEYGPVIIMASCVISFYELGKLRGFDEAIRIFSRG